jgi:hypothetical protein
MANRSIWPTIKPTNAAGLPGDSGGHFRPDPGQNCQRPAPQNPWWSSSALGMPHGSRSLLALSQKALIAFRDTYSHPPTAVTAISAALRANHSHHHATTYRQAALSLGLVQVGVTTDTTCRTVATGRPGIGSGQQGADGRGPFLLRRNGNSVSRFCSTFLIAKHPKA